MSPRSLRASVAVAAFAVAACGFHLQGRAPLPPALKTTYVDAKDEQSDFVQGLRKALLSEGTRVADASTDAAAVVRILEDQMTERVLAVSPSNVPVEYELTYTVRFSVAADGKELLAPQEVSATRQFSFDEHIMLAKDNEEAVLRDALARDLVGVVMRRLSRVQ